MLGDTLRAERERQNLSIKDIETGTSIRALYIECIENGDYSKLPGEVYTKGFIRNYANYLKLDADDLVSKFVEENHPEQAAIKLAQENIAQNKTADQLGKKTGQAFSTGNDFRERVESSHKRQNMLLLVAVILLVAAGAFYLLTTDEKQAVQPKAVQTQTQQAKAPKVETSATPPATTQKADRVEVAARLSDNCWTQVKADGKTVYEGTLEKGKTQTWNAKETIVITAGNAGAIELKVNGKEMGKAGDKGQVVEKTFTPEGEKSSSEEKDSKK